MTTIIFTKKERFNYIRQKDKALFDSPEKEYEYSLTKYKICSKCGINKSLNYFNGNTSGTEAFDKEGYRLRRP